MAPRSPDAAPEAPTATNLATADHGRAQSQHVVNRADALRAGTATDMRDYRGTCGRRCESCLTKRQTARPGPDVAPRDAGGSVVASGAPAAARRAVWASPARAWLSPRGSCRRFELAFWGPPEGGMS